MQHGFYAREAALLLVLAQERQPALVPELLPEAVVQPVQVLVPELELEQVLAQVSAPELAAGQERQALPVGQALQLQELQLL